MRLNEQGASFAVRAGVLAGALLVCAPAAAQAVAGYALDTLEPSAPTDRFFAIGDAGVRGHLDATASVLMQYQSNSLVLYRGGSSPDSPKVVGARLGLHLAEALTLWDRLLVDAALPVIPYQGGDTRTGVPVIGPAAVGDLRLGVRGELPVALPFDLGVGVDVWLPTGNRDAFTSDGSVRADLKVLASGHRGAFGWATQLGGLYRQSQDLFITRTGPALTYAGGVSWTTAEGALRVEAELRGRWQFAGTSTSPLEALAGLHYQQGRVVLGVAAGRWLVKGAGAAPLRLLAMVSWAPGAVSDLAPDAEEESPPSPVASPPATPPEPAAASEAPAPSAPADSEPPPAPGSSTPAEAGASPRPASETPDLPVPPGAPGDRS
jgi:OOP family OmpA-OmpF porin